MRVSALVLVLIANACTQAESNSSAKNDLETFYAGSVRCAAYSFAFQNKVEESARRRTPFDAAILYDLGELHAATGQNFGIAIGVGKALAKSRQQVQEEVFSSETAASLGITTEPGITGQGQIPPAEENSYDKVRQVCRDFIVVNLVTLRPSQ